MKTEILDLNNKKEINVNLFEGDIREDIVQKIAEKEKEKHPSAPFLWAGMETSASGNVKHNRHVWKTDRGKGLGRFPKKRMSDKGDRFSWVGAVIPGVKGGRRAHPPRVVRRELKINKKEELIGMKSCFVMSASKERLIKKYSTLTEKDISIKLPIILSKKVASLKTKEFYIFLRKIFGEKLFNVAIKHRKTRCGVGKMRGRRYKSNAGLLMIKNSNEKIKINGIDIIDAKKVKIKDMALNGIRLIIFTEDSIEELKKRINEK